MTLHYMHPLMKTDNSPLWHQLLTNLNNSDGYGTCLGWSLLRLCILLILLIRRKYLVEVLFIYSALIPFMLVLSGVHFTTQRYAAPLLPALLILTGKMLADAITAPSVAIRWIGPITVFIAVTFSALSTLAGNLQFTS